MFWRRRPNAEEEISEPEAPSALAPVKIFTADGTIEGWLDIEGQRLSDVLNVEDLLSVSRVAAGPTANDWFVIERERMLIVIPPSLVSDPRARLHRLRRPAAATIGVYTIEGLAHAIAGIPLDATLARSQQHFLPVTDAWITAADGSMVEHHPAALVNIRATGVPFKLDVVE